MIEEQGLIKAFEFNYELAWKVMKDLLLPYMFDISIYAQIDNSDLIGHIDRVGTIFYRRDLR